MKLTKSGSFPILERSLITLTDDRRRLDCTPLLSRKDGLPRCRRGSLLFKHSCLNLDAECSLNNYFL
ncbi:hypothetical protein CEXT_192411 [Caerostris extrusa]|uniref:Uncharacterized protein n=1 Tax=Caerostris extrusa TaxID=172846 RepID=A0AAV4VMS7_CAEEX|nr:hypothetical protein CEXT_192411 [Caerostris extrusa]